METLTLQATKRSQKANHVRAGEEIPAVVYGHGIATESVALPYASFVKTYKQAGGSTLLDLQVAGESSRKVLVHDVQRDPLTSRLLHVDLYAVQMMEKMKTKVSLKFIGESPAVKQRGGLLVKNLNHVQVECLPGDLVHEIAIDLSGLTEYGKSIYVRDIVPPKGIIILDKPQEPVVTVMKPKTEEELAKELATETTEVKVEDAVKVQEKGKKEEEGAEGADAKAGEPAKGGAPAGGKPAAKGGKGGDDKKK